MANPKVEAAYFLVQNGPNGDKKYVKGSDFKRVATGSEVVWVQRGTTGTEKYWAWYGQPNNLGNPDFSYRLKYYITPAIDPDSSDPDENVKTQPDGDGVINFSLYFDAPGPYPMNEWRNVRNKKLEILDLDGKTLKIRDNTDLKNGDVCRIVHETGNLEAWYVVNADTDANNGHNYLKFRDIYTLGENDNGKDPNRERVDIKVKGSRPVPNGSTDSVLRLEFYSKANAKPYHQIADTDWVWAQTTESNGSLKKWKVSGREFKALFIEITPNFEVMRGEVRMNMRFFNQSQRVTAIRESDGREIHFSGNYTNSPMPVGNWFIPTLEAGGLQCIRLHGTGNNADFEFKPNFDMSTVQNMSHFVDRCGTFNSNIAFLDFSNVVNASWAFYGCNSFNADIGGGFDMKKCTNAELAFACMAIFNQPINQFKFPAANELRQTFYRNYRLNQSVTGIEYKDNVYLYETFTNCANMNHPKDAEQFPFPSHVRFHTTMGGWTGFNHSIANWTQPLPHYTSGLFRGWSQFNQSIAHLNISNLKAVAYWFMGSAFNNDSLKNWDFTNSPLYDVTGWFGHCDSFSPADPEYFSNWDTSKFTCTAYLFQNSAIGCSTAGVFNLSNWNVSNVYNMSYMFVHSNLTEPNMEAWDVSKVKNMAGTFNDSIITEDLNGWDVSNVTDMRFIFHEFATHRRSTAKNWGYNQLGPNIKDWDVSNVGSFRNAFSDIPFNHMLGPFDLWRWRMPKLHGSDYQYDYDDETNPRYQWDHVPYGYQEYNYAIKSRPAFNMKPISPSYKPDYTIRLSSNASNATRSDFNVRYYSKVISSHDHGDERDDKYNTLNRPRAHHVLDIFAPTNGGAVQFGSDSRYSDQGRQENWEFAEPFGKHPELVNTPANMAEAFWVNSNSRYFSNVTGFEYINTANVTCMYGTFFGHYNMASAINHVEITNWDVSNVTNMNLFAGNCTKDAISFGDLRGWCVQHIPSTPNRWTDSIGVKVFKEDPCWGQCPPPGELGTCGSDQAPIMPNGPWKTYAQQYYFRALSGRNTIYFLTNVYVWISEDNGTTWYDWGLDGNFEAYAGDYVIIASNGLRNDDMIKFLGRAVDIEFLAADTSNVTNMTGMFNSVAFNSDISWFDTFRVNNMSRMFRNCKMFNADISGWDTSNVTNMHEMFYDNSQFKQDLSGWNVDNVSNHRDFDRNANTQWRVTEKPRW